MKTMQKRVGCCVPHCEQNHCDRKFKRLCALRKYFLLEVKRIRKTTQICYDIMGAEWVKAYIEQVYYWRKHEQKRRKKSANMSKN